MPTPYVDTMRSGTGRGLFVRSTRGGEMLDRQRVGLTTIAILALIVLGCRATGENPNGTGNASGSTAGHRGSASVVMFGPGPSGGGATTNTAGTGRSAGGSRASTDTIRVPEIRVRLVEAAGQRTMRVNVPAPTNLIATHSGQSADLGRVQGQISIESGPKPGSMIVNGQAMWAETLAIAATSATQLIQVAAADGSGWEPIAGDLTIRVTRGGQLEPIVTMGLERYVTGSVLAEMPASFGTSALRAQAIAIRTYAAYKVIANRNRGEAAKPYDVQSSVADLKYNGPSHELPPAIDAVTATRGEVLTYNGQLFLTFFHSTSGGATVPASRYFGGYKGFGPLDSVVPSDSSASSVDRWRTQLSWREVRAKLIQDGAPEARLGTQLRTILRLFPAGSPAPPANVADPANRPKAVEFVTDRGTYRMDAARMRAVVGSGRDAMPSTCVAFSVSGDTIHLAGRGWGHGVGMCQYGASALGNRGATYAQILAHYYPGSTRSRIAD